jgi:hypothetical protein
VQRRPVLGEQRLVRGHHAPARPQRFGEPAPRGLDAAHDLDHDVHVVALDQAERVRGEQRGIDRQVAPLAAEPAYRDADDVERRTDPGGQVVGLVVQQSHDLGADGATAQQRKFHRPHPTSNASRSASVSRRTITREAPSRTATTGGRGTWL